MKAFADLYAALDETTKTNEKVAALRAYYENAPPADAAWAAYFLIGRKPRQVVPTKFLRLWAREEAGVAEWLFNECYDAVGDLAETIALLLPTPTPDRSSDRPLAEWVARLLAFRGLPEAEQRTAVVEAWRELDRRQRFVCNKLIGGGFRVGVSQGLVIRAISQAIGVDAPVLAHRMMGDWTPSPEFFARLASAETSDADAGRPYPFYLAHPLEAELASLGEPDDWQAEWKWDGIRAQLIRRGSEVFLWSRGEELVTDRYPELQTVGDLLPPGTVLDGEILPIQKDTEAPLPFAQLQRRIGRKVVSKAILASIPVALIAYDLMEFDGVDVRERPLGWRREQLAAIVAKADYPERLRLSPIVKFNSWEALAESREESRERGAEGLMLKRITSPYRVGRVRGDWWKWKVDPFTIDAVLTAAQRGSGKRASLYTDYTFSLWQDGRLVTIAKAYSGLTDAEIRSVDQFIRRNMIEKFGPVRTVKPELVFELGFEGIQASSRHKSGVAVRFPRMLRQRTDKKAEDADTLDTLKALLPDPPGG